MYNILINNLSTVNPKKLSEYLLKVDGTENMTSQECSFSGIYTNEPVTHALLRKYANEEQGEHLDHILSLASDKVLDDKIIRQTGELNETEENNLNMIADHLEMDKEMARGLTHYEFYHNLVMKQVRDEFLLEPEQDITNYMPDMKYERIPNIPEASDIHKAVLNLAEQVIDIYQNHPDGCCLYLDYTGGDRSTSTIVIALTKMLEERGISVDHIWAVNFDPSASVNEIREKTEVNYIFDFISGLQEFLNYGRANILDAFLTKSEKKGFLQISPEASKVQEKIRFLADEIQLCRSAKIVEGIGQLVKAINSYEKNDKIHDAIFDYLIGDIKNNYIQIYKPAQRTVPNIIRWCLDKNLIQQAATMYVELLPEYLIVEKKILFYDETDWGKKVGQSFIYLNEVQNYIQNGSCNVEELKREGRAKKTSYRNYRDSYAYLNYYIWGEIADRAGYKHDSRQNEYARCKKMAVLVSKYALSGTSKYVQVKKGVNQRQLQDLLLNYMLFKSKIRHALNHATSKSIKVKELRDNMVWRNIEIFECADPNSDMSVGLLVAMMRDLLEQIDMLIPEEA